MANPQAEQIAAGLTEAQRALVIESEPGGWGRDDTACGAELIGAGKWAAARALSRKRLGDVVEDFGMYPPGLYFNTQLGLAVRESLRKQA